MRRVQKGSFLEQWVRLYGLGGGRWWWLAEGLITAMKVGYARVSTEDQCLDLQRDALHSDGCDRIFEEKMTGTAKSRPALQAALDALQRGDVLVVWKLDRLGRSFQHLIEVVCSLEARGVGFCSLSDRFATTSPGGKLIFHIAAAFAEFERAVIAERTKAGMQAAKRRGQSLGRPRRMTPDDVERARLLISRDELSIAHTAKSMGIGKTTIWRSLKDQILQEAGQCCDCSASMDFVPVRTAEQPA